MHSTSYIPRDFHGSNVVIVKRTPIPPLPADKKGFGFTSVSTYSEEVSSIAPRSITPTSSNIKIISSSQSAVNSSSTTTGTSTTVSSVPWYQSLQGLLVAAGIFTAVVVVAVLSATLGVILSRNPSVVSTTTPATNVRNATWNFDNNLLETGNTYNAVLVTGPSFNTVSYLGYGASMLFVTALGGAVTVPSPFFNLSYTSFTVEAWIYMTLTTGDNAVLSQCECVNCQGRCLALMIRNGRLYMVFSLTPLTGSTALANGTWHHIAFVYDYSSRTQSVYMQGVLDGTKSSSDPYQGQNGSLLIGNANLTSSFFDGLIDTLTITTKAKSDAEILISATQVAYFSFDGTSVTEDQGPNKIYSRIQNAITVNGKVGRGLLFSGTLSMLQAHAFWQLSQPNRDFSIALWVNPVLANGTLIQKTRNQNSSSGPCCIYMAFSGTGQIVYSIPSLINTTQIYGPFISINQWTHLGYTYSLSNGITMYINGSRYGSSGAIFYNSTASNHDWLNVGWSPHPCTSALTSISNGFFQGAIDELYVYRRELSANEITSLVNV